MCYLFLGMSRELMFTVAIILFLMGMFLMLVGTIVLLMAIIISLMTVRKSHTIISIVSHLVFVVAGLDAMLLLTRVWCIADMVVSAPICPG
jgi:hypothetical protein